MALSSFIKQLLETDTVFGSEAKKVTGINDSIVRTTYQNSNISFEADDTSFRFIINNYNVEEPVPEWLIADKYIKFFFRNYIQNSANLQLLQYEDRLFQLLSNPTVNATTKTLTIEFKSGVEGTPPFSQLSSNNFLDLDVIIDGRIFTLIGDPDIARESSNGSTMFNLNNTDSTAFTVDSSGIAKKYGSHYHTDISSELTVHDRDNAGYPLVRPAIGVEGISQTILYNETAARVRAQQRLLNSTNTRVLFKFGLNTELVAMYGKVGLRLSGNFINISPSNPPRFPPDTTVNIPIIAVDPASNVLTVSNHNGLTVGTTITVRDSSNSPVGGFVIVSFPTGTSINVTRLSSNRFPSVGNIITSVGVDGDETDSDGFTFRGITWIANLKESERVVGVKLNWPVSRNVLFDPLVVAGIAMNDLASLLNQQYSGEYTFSRTQPSSLILINYVGVQLVDDTSQPTTINNGGTGNFIFHDSTPFLPGQAEKNITGVEFKTKAELINLLRLNTFGFTIRDPADTIVISTDSVGSREVTIEVPTFVPPVFSNENTLQGLIDIPVSDNTYRTITLVPELIFDGEGNAIFNLPTSVVQEL